MVFRIPLARAVACFISITLLAAFQRHLQAQALSNQLPPAGVQQTAPQQTHEPLPNAPGTTASDTSSTEGSPFYPVAQVVEDGPQGTKVVIESTNPQTRVGSLYTLDKDVVITYGDRTIRADHIEYDSDTGEIIANGHLVVSGGVNDEFIAASHGAFNAKTQTGTFYDVSGSVGLRRSNANRNASTRVVYDNGNPFLFTGRIVVKKGPRSYDVIDGSVTSCQLPKPDWQLNAALFSIDGEKAKAKNTVFHLLNLPLLYLPYVTHPVDPESRQSGFMIPVLGDSSSKGVTFGDEFYIVLNRSADLTLGSIYYSSRGFSEAGTFRYRGRGPNFASAHFSALQDRGYVPDGGVYTNQGGQDVTVKARFDLVPPAASGSVPEPATEPVAQTRFVADVEYLSSYIYREAFTDNFNQAVSTDILSYLYGVRNANGHSVALRVDRYEGLKPRPQTAAQIAEKAPVINSQVTVFHIPDLTFTTTDHRLAGTHLLWSLDSSASGLKRTQPAFTTSGVGRLDLRPEIALPLEFAGLHICPSVAARETLYSQSRKTPFIPGTTPVESPGAFNRAAFEAEVDIRPPVLERTFDSPLINRTFGGEVKHAIEPSMTYRYVGGVNNFASVLRFDDIDTVSDTNELEYGITQRLFLHPGKPRPCKIAQVADNTDDDNSPDDAPNGKPAAPRCSSREFFKWRIAQKIFFQNDFGAAIIGGRRNILDTTLSFSGIAFLTNPRSTSPVISRLSVRPSEKLDVEWDFDYDIVQKKFTSSNVFADVRQGNLFGGFSYAGLHAPGQFDINGRPSSTTDFSQTRVLLGYGTPTKAGLSVAANAGIDLNLGTVQYGSLQTSYNWNCCGFSVEYRKYELGSVRNENAYRFNFTLANIGTAGNLRRAERLF